jgi:hypothetical protein
VAKFALPEAVAWLQDVFVFETKFALPEAVAWLQDVVVFGFFGAHVEISFIICRMKIVLLSFEARVNLSQGFVGAAADVAMMKYDEERRLLVCYAVWLLYEPTFRRNLAPPSSG